MKSASVLAAAKDLVKNNYDINPGSGHPLLSRITPPEGYIYKWISFGITSDRKERGEEIFKENLKAHERGGWKAVPHSRHPELPSEGPWIVYANQILSEWNLPPAIEQPWDISDIAIQQMVGNSEKEDVKTDPIDPFSSLPKHDQKRISRYIKFGGIEVNDK